MAGKIGRCGHPDRRRKKTASDLPQLIKSFPSTCDEDVGGDCHRCGRRLGACRQGSLYRSPPAFTPSAPDASKTAGELEDTGLPLLAVAGVRQMR